MTLTRNITANAISRLWQAGAQLIVTPVVLHLLGPEAYGLIGFHTILLMFLVFLDQSVSPVLSRELARLKDQNDGIEEARNLLRTTELVSLVTAVLVGGLVILLAPQIAKNWIATNSIAESDITTAVRLMGLGIAAQWPTFLYGGAFAGLQRQDVLALIRIIGATVQAVGAVVILYYVSATASMYLLWMAVSFAAMSMALKISIWQLLPSKIHHAKFDKSVIEKLWRFALGTLLIGLTGAIVSQAPGFILAKYSSLEQLAIFSLGLTLTVQVSTILSQPMMATLLPHFSVQFKRLDTASLESEYHRWSQITAVLVLPVAGVLLLFSNPLIKLWLGNSTPIANHVADLFIWLVPGVIFNAFAQLPLMLLLATRRTKMVVIMNVFIIIFLVPLLVLFTPEYGVVASAFGWMVINMIYYVIFAGLVHSIILPGVLWSWWWRDTLMPLGVTAVILAISWGLREIGVNIWWDLAHAIVTGMAVLAGLLMVNSAARIEVLKIASALKN